MKASIEIFTILIQLSKGNSIFAHASCIPHQIAINFISSRKELTPIFVTSLLQPLSKLSFAMLS